jgi:hypothetical protein
MAATVEEICNKALSRLGIKQKIINLTTEVAAGVVEAVECSNNYANARDYVTAAFAWPFATVKATLVIAVGEAAWDGWKYIFTLPTSPIVLMPIAVVPPGYAYRAQDRVAGSPYMIVKSSMTDVQVILTDLPNAVLYYTTRITDMTKFPLEFEDAIAYRLAMEIAMPLNADPRRAEYAAKKYADRVKDAQSGAWNGYASEDDMPDAEFIQDRS